MLVQNAESRAKQDFISAATEKKCTQTKFWKQTEY